MDVEYVNLLGDIASSLVIAGVAGYLSHKLGYMHGLRANETELSEKVMIFDSNCDISVDFTDNDTGQVKQFNSMNSLMDWMKTYF